MAKGKKIVDITEEILNAFLPGENLSLYDVEYVKEGPDRVLRVYIDKTDDYVGTHDCEIVSKYLSDKLDEIDPIEENYLLEVSSPGIDRELRRDEHFERYTGEVVDVSLYKAIDGEKKLTGKLVARNNKELKINIAGEEKTIALELITRVNLAVTI